MKNPLSSLSYTNKDFQTIYVELLGLVKQLTRKWDPSISNESDPGVILLKLNALIADKNNYNIDKNVLELFPETVTQEINARNLYKQLGYKMPWYQAAKTTVLMHWVGGDITPGSVVEIPKYTMITNSDNSIVYTILQDAEFTSEIDTVSVTAAQGILTEYKVNSSNVVTMLNLDYENRLYLSDYAVAQNCVFITNSSNPAVWEEVDNLVVEQEGNRFYEFGVDSKNSACYLKFPNDIGSLIKEGLNIKYLATDGVDGSIAAKDLDRFYGENTINYNGNAVVLNTDVVELYNNTPSTGGKDPQTIEDAHISYKKVAGTFNTLVTLRDYINFIYSSGLISNNFVCDRLNDVQSSYTIVTDSAASPFQQFVSEGTSGVSYRKVTSEDQWDGNTTYFEFNADTKAMAKCESPVKQSEVVGKYVLYTEHVKDLEAFDLRMYLLQKPSTMTSNDDYDSSFNMLPSQSATQQNIVSLMLDTKCVQHDFRDIIPNVPCMFRNTFPLQIKIIPQYRLSDTEISEVQVNIVSALREKLNSSNIEFGAEPDYDVIYDTVSSADERIKVCILNDFEYTTYAIYWDGKEFVEIPLSKSSSDIIHYCSCTDESSSPKKYVAKYLSEKQKTFLSHCYFITDCELDADGKFASNAPKRFRKGSVMYYIYKWDIVNKRMYEYSTRLTEQRLDVIVKSILSGKTALFKDDNLFQTTIQQQYIDSFDADRIGMHFVVSPFSTNEDGAEKVKVDTDGDGAADNDQPIAAFNENPTSVYTLKKNESVRFLGAAFDKSLSYSSYIKFVAVLKDATDKLVLMDTDTEQFAGSLYITDADFDKVCLSEWRDLHRVRIVEPGNEGNPFTTRALKFDAEAGDASGVPPQASIVIPNNINANYPQYYEVQFEMHCLAGEGNQGIPFRTLTVQHTGTDGSGEVVEAATICNVEQQGTPNTYRTVFLANPAAGSIALTFRAAANFNGSAYIDNVTVVRYDAVASAPEFQPHKYYASESLGSPITTTDVNYVTTDAYGAVVWSTAAVGKTVYTFEPHVTISPSGTVVNGKFVAHKIDLNSGVFNIAYEEHRYYEESGDGEFVGLSSQPAKWKTDYRTSYYEAGTDLDGVLTYYTVSHTTNYFDPGDTTSSSVIHCGTFDKYDESWDWYIDPEYDGYRRATVTTFKEGNKEVQMWEDGLISFRYIDDDRHIKKDSCYKLKDEEFVIFFWRESDDDNAPYRYKKYVGIPKEHEIGKRQSPVIQPNFKLQGVSDDENDLVKYLGGLPEEGYVNQGDKYYTDISGLYGDNDLSGNREITIVTMKQVDSENKKDGTEYISKYYFVTNNISTDTDGSQQYELRFKKFSVADDDTVRYRYYMGPDEIFVYINSSGTAYTIKGSGTLIGIDINKDSETMKQYIETFNQNAEEKDRIPDETVPKLYIKKVPLVSYSAITEKGLEVLEDNAITLSTDEYLFARDQQLYNLVEGDKITLTIDEGTEFEAFDDGGNCLLTEKPVFYSFADTPVKGFTVQYGENNTSLPPISIGEDADSYWVGRASLNLITSSEEPEIIVPYSTQVNDKVTGGASLQYVVYQKDGTTMDTLNQTNSFCVQSDSALHKVGGNNIEVSYTDLYGDAHSSQFYLYSLDDTYAENGISVDSKGYININVKRSPNEIDLPVKLENNSNYILAIRNRSLDCTFELSCEQSDVLTTLTQTTENQFKIDGYGTYYYLLYSGEDSVAIHLKVNIPKNYTPTDSDILTIQPLYRYKEKDAKENFEDLYGISTQDIIDRIQELDYENKFKYNYIVDKTTEIKDPLDAAAFFDTEHIFNKFTIAKAEVRMGTATGSSIQTVNNR